jgi:hypothetical protein
MVWFLFMNLWPKCGGAWLCMHDWLWCLIMYATTLKENIDNLMAWGVKLLHYLTEISNFCVYCASSSRNIFWRFEIQNLCNILCPIKVNNLKPCSGKHSWGNIRVRPCQIICSYRIQQFLVRWLRLRQHQSVAMFEPIYPYDVVTLRYIYGRGVARAGAGGPAPPPWQNFGPLLIKCIA